MTNIPKEFKQFCLENDIERGTPEYSLAKEAWNKAIEISSDVVSYMEHVDYGISDDYTIVDDN